MALIHCASCGRQVSDQAAACPQCGHPIATKGRGIGKAVWIVLGVIALGIIAVIAIGSLAGDSHPNTATIAPIVNADPPAPVVKFTVLEHSQRDDECTELGDYCIRVHCTFYNSGNGPGEKAVGAQLLDGSESVAVRESTLTLLPDKSQSLYFDFKEAELDGNHHYSSRCAAADHP